MSSIAQNWKWEWLLPLLSFGTNCLFLAYDLPETSHPDEMTIVKRAMAMGAGDLNPHYLRYPTLWIYLVFFAQGIGVAFGFILALFKDIDDVIQAVFVNPTYFFLVARLLSAGLGAGSVWLMWRIGSQVSPLSGWVAALSLSLFAPFVWQAHYATGDIPLLFFVLLCLNSCLHGLGSASKWESFWKPAILAGLATSIKYNGIFAFGPVAMMLFLRCQREKAGWHTCCYRLAMACMVAALTFVLTSPYFVLDFTPFLQGSREIIDLVILVSEVEANPFAYLRLVFIKQGSLFFLLAVLGWTLLFSTSWGRRHRLAGWVLAAHFVPYLAVIHLANYKADRYFLPFAPALSLGVGIAIAYLHDTVVSLRFRPFLGRTVIGAVICLLLAPSLQETVRTEAAFSQESAFSIATKWFKNHVEPGSTVFVDAVTAVHLPPDRVTVERRMRLWREDNSGKARQLLRAYTYYLRTDMASRGYALVPTESYLLNTFKSGYDMERDYGVSRLGGVRYVIVPGSVLRTVGQTSRDRFYEYVRARYRVLQSFPDEKGSELLILERCQDLPFRECTL